MTETPRSDILSSFMTSSWSPHALNDNYTPTYNFSSKTSIVTTKRKKRVVDELQDYWRLKGLLLKIKRSPALIVELETSKHIINFLETYTDIPQQAFWYKLSQQQKYAIARRLTIIEGHSNKQCVSTTSKVPEIFIVLSGKVEARQIYDQDDGEAEQIEYAHGSIFGAHQKFHEVADALFSNQSPPSSSSAASKLMQYHHSRTTASVTMCTLLKLTLKDYLLEIAPSKSNYDNLDEDEYVMVTSGLTIEDAMCLRFTRQSEKSLSKTLYEFLVEYEILPKNSESSSYQYLCTGSIGRGITLNREANLVYIIIEGSIRMQLVKPSKVAPEHHSSSNIHVSSSSHDIAGQGGRKGGGFYEMSCHREGQSTINIKTMSLPVMIVEEGSVFAMTEACFDIKHPSTSLSASIGSSSQTFLTTSSSWLAAPQAMKIDGSYDLLQTSGSLAPIQPLSSTTTSSSSDNIMNTIQPLRVSSKRRNRRDKKHRAVDEMYQIQVVFDRPTKYLAIPMELFKVAMKETSVETNKEITRQLNLISASIVERITSMLPWICDKMELWLKDPAPSPKKSASLPGIEKNQHVEGSIDHDNRIDVTYGSFYESKNRIELLSHDGTCN